MSDDYESKYDELESEIAELEEDFDDDYDRVDELRDDVEYAYSHSEITPAQYDDFILRLDCLVEED